MGGHVFLKVMPKRGVIRFGKRGKLALKRVGIVAYQLALPPSLSGVHKVFHVSMLRKYTLGLAHIVDWGEITVDTDGTFEKGPVRILDSWDQVLRRKTMRLVKVLWQHQGVEKATWERKDTIEPPITFYLRTKVRCLKLWN